MFNGRRKIYTNKDLITAENVIPEVIEAMGYHSRNSMEEDELFWYRRGIQPILQRTKTFNTHICNKVVVNFADQVTVFKNGYFLTKPVFYTGRNGADNEKVKQLNNFLYTSGKHEADNEIVDSFHTMGVAALFIEPNRDDFTKQSSPVKVYSLDPRSAFVVYSLRPGHKPVMGINCVMTSEGTVIDVFTEFFKFTLKGSKSEITEPSLGADIPYEILSVEPNILGKIPIIEYYANDNRMACFEAAIDLMNEYNSIESDIADGVEQFIQSIIVATNVDFDDDVTATTIKQSGMVCLKSNGENKADFKILSEQLDQAQTQVSLDNIEKQILAKCGMPASGSSGASFENVGAAYMDRGYAIADTYNRNTEDCYRKCNKLFTEVFMAILRQSIGFDIDVNQLDIQFNRPELDNMLVRTQAALNLKNLGLSPQIILAKTGLSSDPINDVADSKEYIDYAFATAPAPVEKTEKTEETVEEIHV